MTTLSINTSIEGFDLILSNLVRVKPLYRSLSGDWNWIPYGLIFIPVFLFWRNGHRSFTKNSNFGLWFAVVLVSVAHATIYTNDNSSFARRVSFFWSWTYVLHHGQLFWCKFLKVYSFICNFSKMRFKDIYIIRWAWQIIIIIYILVG